ncbi:hypothetical protein N7522_012182 [Penicillium canescens]|nr:hypothetical protein N7522_012182 [Penicillium canescens]
MSSLPTFEPYVLTPFDHSTAPVHFSGFFAFTPGDLPKSISVLEAGVSRLVTLLPFLSGNITLSDKLQGKENVFEVQPPTAEFLEDCPMLKIRHHEQSICTAKDNLLNEAFLPIAFEQAAEDLSPIFRFQANVMVDGVFLCFTFNHMAVDGVGVWNVAKSLAVCCRDPGAPPNLLETDVLQEAQCRRTIFEAASSRNTKALSLKDWFPAPGIGSQDPVSARLVLDAEKVAKLRHSCSATLRINFSSNTIVMAVLWFCFIRARFGLRSTQEEQSVDESCLVVVSDTRSKLQPNIPMSYIGNVVVTTEAYIRIEPIISAMTLSSYDSRSSGAVGLSDVSLLANLAESIHKAIHCVTNDYVRDLLSDFVGREDWTSTPRLGDIFVSTFRPVNFYELDFGTCLGALKDIDIPENRFSGSSWILPAPGKGRSGAWEVRLTLEPMVMDRLQNDDLMKWLRPDYVSKL